MNKPIKMVLPDLKKELISNQFYISMGSLQEYNLEKSWG